MLDSSVHDLFYLLLILISEVELKVARWKMADQYARSEGAKVSRLSEVQDRVHRCVKVQWP